MRCRRKINEVHLPRSLICKQTLQDSLSDTKSDKKGKKKLTENHLITNGQYYDDNQLIKFTNTKTHYINYSPQPLDQHDITNHVITYYYCYNICSTFSFQFFLDWAFGWKWKSKIARLNHREQLLLSNCVKNFNMHATNSRRCKKQLLNHTKDNLTYTKYTCMHL